MFVMLQVTFQFHGALNDFLPPARRGVQVTHLFKERSSVKDAIESLGVPHPEVDLILVNGVSVNFGYLIQENDGIQVYSAATAPLDSVSLVRSPPLPEARFVLDVHLGKLANHLRLLGFDVLYQNDYRDAELAQISSQDDRILLTQDRALLKRGRVTYGYCVRNSDPWQQTIEVLSHFRQFGAIAPMRRCLRCNGLLQAVDKAEITERLPPLTRQHYDKFSICHTCGQIYWQGAHHSRIQQFIDSVTQFAQAADYRA